MSQPIYNKSLETHTPVTPHTTSQITPEDYERLFGGTFKPDRDTGGKVIAPPPMTPFKITEKKDAPRANSGRKPRRLTVAPHVDKPFIELWLSKGKSLEMIAKENDIPIPTMRNRAEGFGLYTPKTYSKRIIRD